MANAHAIKAIAAAPMPIPTRAPVESPLFDVSAGGDVEEVNEGEVDDEE